MIYIQERSYSLFLLLCLFFLSCTLLFIIFPHKTQFTENKEINVLHKVVPDTYSEPTNPRKSEVLQIPILLPLF